MRDGEDRARKFAKQLRGTLTDAETILWSNLRRKRMLSQRFRRQHPIGPFIADFACVPAKLVVEVDGATHGSDDQIAHDARRTAYLRRLGWHEIRVTNHDVYKRLDDVLEFIWSETKKRLPTPARREGH